MQASLTDLDSSISKLEEKLKQANHARRLLEDSMLDAGIIERKELALRRIARRARYLELL